MCPLTQPLHPCGAHLDKTHTYILRMEGRVFGLSRPIITVVQPAQSRLDKYGNKVTCFWFHNFRHALATFLIENGHDPAVVQRMLPHSQVDMTMHYTHKGHKRRQAQAQFIERFLPEGEPVRVRVPERSQ